MLALKRFFCSLSLSLSVFLRIRVRILISGRENENLDRRHKKDSVWRVALFRVLVLLSKKKKSSQFVRTKRHLTLLWNARKNHDDFTIKRDKEEGTALLLSLSL